MAIKKKTTKLSVSKNQFLTNPIFIVIVLALVAVGIFFAFGVFAQGGAHDPGGTLYKDHYGCSRDYRARPTIGVGSAGACVQTLQDDLSSRGIYIGPNGIDGKFGTNTANAVKYFQATYSLSPDGTVGPKTWIVLYCNVEVNGCS